MSPIQWFGGKGKLKKRIISLFSNHTCYCEPYGGAASVMWAKDPSPVEVYNDLNGDLVNLFRALQDPQRLKKLRWRLKYTLYSHQEYQLALEVLAKSKDPDERAWAFFVAQNQGFAGRAGSWGRSVTSSSRGMASATSQWLRRLTSFSDWYERVMRVQIDHRDGVDVVRSYDTAKTLFYVDPPYVQSSRKSGKYAHEMTDEDHRRLLETLLAAQGMVILSGYDNELYNQLLAGWDRIEIQTVCHAVGRKKGGHGEGWARENHSRVEVIWRNPAAVENLRKE